MTFKKIGFWLLVVIFIVGAFIVYKTFFAPKAIVQTPVEVLTSDIEEVNADVASKMAVLPKGLASELESTRLYFMLTNKAEKHDDQFTQTFVFQDGALSSPVAEQNDIRDLYYSYSLDGESGVFLAIPPEKKNEAEDVSYQSELFTFKRGDLGRSGIPTLAQSTSIDSSKLLRKQNPTISNSGEVLFVGWEGQGMPMIEKAEDWSIFRVANGKTEFLTKGYMPKWVSDTEFVYFKNDGLYIANSDLSGEKLIQESAGIIHNNNRLDVSDDGMRLAWMEPDHNTVDIFVRDGDFVPNANLELKGYWVAFSPSGEYMALQTINSEATGAEANPQAKIEFYDMNTYAKVPELEIDLDAFDQQGMFMNDWVNIMKK
jgi:hypothetical protein